MATSPQVARAGRRRPFACKLRQMCVVTTGPLLIAGGFGWLGATAFHWAFETQRQELTAQRLFMRSLSKSSARHSAHIRLGPADFGMPAPTREERSALTKSASPPTKHTFRENRIEVAFSDRIEDTACISSTAWTISIMEKVASWVALDCCVPADWRHRGPRASIRAAFEASGRQGCHVVALD